MKGYIDSAQLPERKFRFTTDWPARLQTRQLFLHKLVQFLVHRIDVLVDLFGEAKHAVVATFNDPGDVFFGVGIGEPVVGVS